MVAIATSPKSLLTNGPSVPVGQLGFDVVHLVAQALPRRVDVADLVLQVDVDDERSFGDQRANVLDVGKLADFALDRDGDEILHPFGRHSGKQCGHDRGADDDDRVFALGKIGIERDADDEQARP